MGLFPMCLSKYTPHSHTSIIYTQIRRERKIEKRKRKRKEEEEEEGEGKKGRKREVESESLELNQGSHFGGLRS